MTEAGTLVAIIDVSGSMAESGKLMLARNALSLVLEQVEMGFAPPWLSEVEIVSWGVTVEEIVLGDDRSIPEMTGEGRAEVSILLRFLDALLGQMNGRHRVLLLSDGAVPAAEARAFREWRQQRETLDIRALAVGVDASARILKEMTGKDSLRVEDAGMALELLPAPLPEDMQAPASIEDILLPAPEEEEESWD